MNSQRINDSWYVVRTHSRQENRAESNLKAWNVQTFIPKLREVHINSYNHRATYSIKPLFAQYIFARFNLRELKHKINYTRGIQCLVSFGGSPAPVADVIIELIQARIDKNGLIRIGEELGTGDNVVIKEGPLKDFTGIFERPMKDAERVMILLQTVSYQVHVIIEKQLIKKAVAAGGSYN